MSSGMTRGSGGHPRNAGGGCVKRRSDQSTLPIFHKLCYTPAHLHPGSSITGALRQWRYVAGWAKRLNVVNVTLHPEKLTTLRVLGYRRGRKCLTHQPRQRGLAPARTILAA
jgi:hypothetical protein